MNLQTITSIITDIATNYPDMKNHILTALKGALSSNTDTASVMRILNQHSGIIQQGLPYLEHGVVRDTLDRFLPGTASTLRTIASEIVGENNRGGMPRQNNQSRQNARSMPREKLRFTPTTLNGEK